MHWNAITWPEPNADSTTLQKFANIEAPLADARGSDRSRDREGAVARNTRRPLRRFYASPERTSRALGSGSRPMKRR